VTSCRSGNDGKEPEKGTFDVPTELNRKFYGTELRLVFEIWNMLFVGALSLKSGDVIFTCTLVNESPVHGWKRPRYIPQELWEGLVQRPWYLEWLGWIVLERNCGRMWMCHGTVLGFEFSEP
jgi:hypothetical protein